MNDRSLSEIDDITAPPPLNVAVFAHSNLVALVRLDTDPNGKNSAEALSSGFVYCGSIGVNGGEPVVQCEPGRETEMTRGGYIFAGLLGEHLKAYQLRQLGSVRGHESELEPIN